MPSNKTQEKEVEKVTPKRTFHTDESATYWLPKDEDEQFRLAGQHFAIKDLFKGNMHPNIKKALDSEPNMTILDVGCGSFDVANKEMIPNQLTFQLGNVAQRLPYKDSMFDFVYARLLALALSEDEWPLAIQEILRVTKPGGWIQLVDADVKLPDKSTGAFYESVKAIHTICKLRGQNPCIGMELERMLKETGQVEIIDTDYRVCMMNSDTTMAKKFVWNWLEAAKSAGPTAAALMGLTNEEDQKKYMEELKVSLMTKDCPYALNAVTARKLI
ncbi:hypothetical protein G6F57_003157 [Rhizopus arrhizus]|uniref:Methyltransferase type 11 domain-containing protein n=1 Tax=Rhizopus oryzae TaxID=64495 RepID=A0A9P6XI39_RHIOR|nr:hypothetical protein G6F30_002781 [Rhizopus arrhizus]KAG0984535.1 hypothetical protein G6F29_004705 [Rhizopus arrhizus]KAG0996217.1 hypothetical protein G6F28_004053 [Rhizopus arrhizus]KAG1012631.1 hypothetical protein G6F27_002635 [Rhizopus arrhizus]KAG1026117.1 hypothetical protein G6F26_004555 [Rhizopus arrhizus]